MHLENRELEQAKSFGEIAVYVIASLTLHAVLMALTGILPVVMGAIFGFTFLVVGIIVNDSIERARSQAVFYIATISWMIMIVFVPGVLGAFAASTLPRFVALYVLGISLGLTVAQALVRGAEVSTSQTASGATLDEVRKE